MEGKVQTRVVSIDGEDCTVQVSQRSKTVWIAWGKVEGKSIEGKGCSADAAFNDWLMKAEFDYS